MARSSLVLLLICNAVAMLLAVYTITKAVEVKIYGDSDCSSVLPQRNLAFGAFLFVLCLVGITSAMKDMKFLQMMYLMVVVAFVILIFVVTGLVVFGTLHQVKDEEAESGYVLGRYSRWLRRNIVNDREWGAFKNCMITKEVCKKIAINESLSLYQLGCCHPPAYCYLQPENDQRKEEQFSQDHDCVAWNKGIDKLCYDCDTCKAAYIQNFVLNWKYKATILVFTFFILLVCFAFRIDDNSNRRHGGIV